MEKPFNETGRISERVLVTGAAGFIGFSLCFALIEMGYSVTALVSESTPQGRVNELLKWGVFVHRGDLKSKKSLMPVFDQIDVIFHLAAQVRPERWIERVLLSKRKFYQNNVVGTKNLMEMAIDYGVKKVIYFSSIMAIGGGQGLHDGSIPNPKTIYGQSKLEGEKVVCDILTEKVDWVILRPSLVLGEGNPSFQALYRFGRKGLFLGVRNNLGVMPYCYIDDLIDVSIQVMNSTLTRDTFLLSEGNYSIDELSSEVQKGLGNRGIKVYLPLFLLRFFAFFISQTEKLFSLRVHPLRIEFSDETLSRCLKEWSCKETRLFKQLNFHPSYSLSEGMKKIFESLL